MFKLLQVLEDLAYVDDVRHFISNFVYDEDINYLKANDMLLKHKSNFENPKTIYSYDIYEDIKDKDKERDYNTYTNKNDRQLTRQTPNKMSTTSIHSKNSKNSINSMKLPDNHYNNNNISTVKKSPVKTTNTSNSNNSLLKKFVNDTPSKKPLGVKEAQLINNINNNQRSSNDYYTNGYSTSKHSDMVYNNQNRIDPLVSDYLETEINQNKAQSNKNIERYSLNSMTYLKPLNQSISSFNPYGYEDKNIQALNQQHMSLNRNSNSFQYTGSTRNTSNTKNFRDSTRDIDEPLPTASISNLPTYSTSNINILNNINEVTGPKPSYLNNNYFTKEKETDDDSNIYNFYNLRNSGNNSYYNNNIT